MMDFLANTSFILGIASIPCGFVYLILVVIDLRGDLKSCEEALRDALADRNLSHARYCDLKRNLRELLK